jgi:hypothetical protein
LLTFAYSIRNQVLTSFSSLRAASDMRVELNTYLRDFYASALVEARRDAAQGFVFSLEKKDNDAFVQLLLRHRVEVFSTRSERSWAAPDGQVFAGGKTFFVPTDQPQYRLVKAIFERRTTFSDSIFYDISAWTLPDAFGLRWSPVGRRGAWSSDFLNQKITTPLVAVPPAAPARTSDAYAFLVPADEAGLPRALPALLRRGIRVKVATKAFELDSVAYAAGTLLIPMDRQGLETVSLERIMTDSRCGYQVVSDGLTRLGPDLGSSSFVLCRSSRVLVVTGEGASATDAGELWHALDQRLGVAPTLVEASRVGTVSLSKYSVVVLPDGNYPLLSAEKLKNFVNEGGTLVATGAALRWLKNNDIASFDFRVPDDPMLRSTARRPYGQKNEDSAARQLSGAIFEAELDLTHPLCYGYERSALPVFLGEAMFVEPSSNAYNTPVALTRTPLLAGYLHPSQTRSVAGAAGAVVVPVGRGRVVGFAINPVFRGFWLGTERLFANAVLFGHLMR